jgi:hypothetical protein
MKRKWNEDCNKMKFKGKINEGGRIGNNWRERRIKGEKNKVEEEDVKTTRGLRYKFLCPWPRRNFRQGCNSPCKLYVTTERVKESPLLWDSNLRLCPSAPIYRGCLCVNCLQGLFVLLWGAGSELLDTASSAPFPTSVALWWRQATIST